MVNESKTRGRDQSTTFVFTVFDISLESFFDDDVVGSLICTKLTHNLHVILITFE